MNLYLPLTAVYGQWCAKLIVQDRFDWPRMFRCSWTEDGEFHLDAFGGVSRLMEGGNPGCAHVDRAWYGIIRVLRLLYRNEILSFSSGFQYHFVSSLVLFWP
jgi:hypothetical protein